VASAASSGLSAERAPVESYNGPCYLALGRTRLALFVYQPGAFCFAPGPLLASCSLDEMAVCEFRPGRTGPSKLSITTTYGASCDLLVALAHRGTAHRIATAIEGHLQSRAA
jgi:hypothetical protein